MTKVKSALLRSSILAAVFAAQPAHGQNLEQLGDSEAGQSASSGPIVVTGTRIGSFDAPTPVIAVSEVALDEKAVRSVSELMDDVPALRTNQNTGQSSEPVGASNLDLRALGPSRTLVLLDGRRVAATDPTGAFDTNVIPAVLIKKVEIVTGGASAAYGSDAVSGVVQIFLDDRLEGLKGDLQKGISTYGDVATTGASLAAGHGFADGRFHVVGAVDYFKNEGQLFQSSRPWGRDDYALVSNPGEGPARLTAADARFSQLTYGGVTALNSIPALRGIQFGPGGTVLPFEYGTAVGTTFMIGGDGDSLASQANIFPEIERVTGFGKATFDITETTSLYADVLISQIDIFSDGTNATDRGNLTIRRDNAFLPQEIYDILVAENQTSFRIGRIGGEEGAFTNSVDSTMRRYGFGARGELGGKFNWDIGAQFFRNDYHREDGNNRIVRRYALGVDSILVNGSPVCRATAANPNSTDPDIANCVPINVFGAGSISQEALDYYVGTAILDSKQKMDNYYFNFSGSLFETWAGPVDFAVGAEYRKDSIDASSDPISQDSGFITVNPKPLSGSVEVKEAYAEVVVPLLDDQPLGYLLDLNGAVRFTDYSTSGSVTTWKVGANYSPFQDLRLRATYSRDIRAPSVNELFSGQNQLIRNLIDPRDVPPEIKNPTVTELTGGNPDLTPETSTAWTAGFVYSPNWAPTLRASFDYYSFDIEDAIVSLSGAQIVDGCYLQGQTNLCDAITLGDQNQITRVAATLVNAGALQTEGFDIALEYSLPLGNGQLLFTSLVNYISKLDIDGEDFAGQVGRSGGVPHWRGNLGVRYRSDVFGAGVLLRYVDSGTYQNNYVEGVDIDDNSIPSRTYVDLNLSAKVGGGFELYGKVNNLFNLDPPLAPLPITSPSYNGSPFHDRIGRYFKAGVRFDF
ncbi:TonB-dependent receptor plug domain-containing protein [Novosphingobium aquimarinum]|uniref:TonB-dependent receptor plug domain-containing protein n=1 Tax=Novosphingobium aquimarinum TaxID=2682494 RepID=UPI0018DE2638|nr:TonB-dependent receptor [Novosphingobium aquimarinum]